MWGLVGGVALAIVAAQPMPSPVADPCAGDPSCRQASAADLFAAAEAEAAAGNLEGAEGILEALTAEPDPDLRAEARFRLAAVRERRGDLDGAVEALRALLQERPGAQRARLELGRILAEKGEDSEARRELNRASAAGLPNDVDRTVRRFSAALNSLKKRGASLDLAVAADSNVNRATSDRFIDTVIAPFELDPDARSRAGIGLGIGGEAWSRNAVLGSTLLSRAGVRADLFAGQGRFNDIQFALSSGPEFTGKFGRIRPALVHERRWYGGDAYSGGYGGALNWLLTLSPRSQLQLDASVVRQSIRNNAVLDGTRTIVSVAWDHAFDFDTSARFAVRGAALDAEAKPESLRQAGTDLLVAHVFSAGTLFVQASYSRTWGVAPLFLFGKKRHDDRVDFSAGLIARRPIFHGFAPLVRVLVTNSRSNLGLYDYRRARFELGLTREF